MGKALPPIDGVLDLYFRASRIRPLDPIVAQRVHMNGIVPRMLEHCLEGPVAPGAGIRRLGDLRVAIRAIATSPELETFGVVLARDEAGNVFFSDTTAATPRESNWLARRAGHRESSPGKQLEGTRLVMDTLLKTATRGLPGTTGSL